MHSGLRFMPHVPQTPAVRCLLQIELISQARVAQSLHHGEFAALRELCRESGIRPAEYSDEIVDAGNMAGQGGHALAAAGIDSAWGAHRCTIAANPLVRLHLHLRPAPCPQQGPSGPSWSASRAMAMWTSSWRRRLANHQRSVGLACTQSIGPTGIAMLWSGFRCRWGALGHLRLQRQRPGRHQPLPQAPKFPPRLHARHSGQVVAGSDALLPLNLAAAVSSGCSCLCHYELGHWLRFCSADTSICRAAVLQVLDGSAAWASSDTGESLLSREFDFSRVPAIVRRRLQAVDGRRVAELSEKALQVSGLSDEALRRYGSQIR